ncbi:hypothetical protein [Haloferula sargassicola]|uniref:Verru_Chthon cassette protein A n=1 Tax=Haloferula sargassicola TaxID=490096 RepID=A0ABP9UPH3_9BACT
MVLLTLIAVGLLALSSISLRGSRSGESMLEARSNARMALALAIGQLQKAAGPDQRITAPGNLVRAKAPEGLTGVWEASTPAELVTPLNDKDAKFETWLTSGAMRAEGSEVDGEPLAPPDDEEAVVLLGKGSLGENSTGKDLSEEYLLTRPLELSTDRAHGGLGWAVIDESAKARLDLEVEPDDGPGTGLAEQLARVGAPRRCGIFALDQLEGFRPDEEEVSKFASYDSILLGSHLDALKSYRPDLTPWALSLMTDPVDGGLKRDLSTLVTEEPDAFASEGGLYESLGLPGDQSSEPQWASLVDYHNLYKAIGEPNAFTRGVRADAVGAKLPAGLRPYTVRNNRYTANPQVPQGQVLLPSLLRVDMIFSLITRDPHGQWLTPHRAKGNTLMLHLLYLPVITLHNPYDVPLSFESLKLNFQDVPVGFRFLINNQPITNSLIPLNNLYRNYVNSNESKIFGVTLRETLGGGGSETITLEPGQTKLFGTARVEPTWTWNDEDAGGAEANKQLFDWANDKTTNFEMIPTLMTDHTTGAGFDVDWLAGRDLAPAAQRYCQEGTLGLRANDQVSVEWGPIRQPNSEFFIAMELNRRPAGIYRIKYGNEANLRRIVSEGTSDRYPEPREFPMIYPDRNSPSVAGGRIYEPGSRAIRDYSRPRPFAIFSFSGKTTRESFVPARPYADASTNLFVADIDLSGTGNAPGDQPYELVMVPVLPGTGTIGENREEEEGYFFGGHDIDRGTPRATFYEIPRLPLQSLAQFRHANLANSGTPPFMTYTVGESWAHPMLPTDDVQGRSASNQTIYDHCYLSNAALWDRYFLSTMSDYEGPAFGTTRSASEVRQGFFRGEEPLLNPRFQSLVPAAEAEDAAGDLGQAAGDRMAAKYLAMKGGFNVNSTSVDAWIAVLSSLRDTTVASQEDGDTASESSTPFPRVRYPSAGPVELGGSFFGGREGRWQGYRQLDEDQIKELAENIVDEVRERGPFLSLAEFVNRKLGGSGDETSLRGAIANAIHNTDINSIVAVDGLEITPSNIGTHNWQTPQAAMGNNIEGAPGALTQGDILSALGSQLTVRGDTFLVRAYGESSSNQGRIEARAWCEAVVQRVPDFVDPGDVPETASDELSPINRSFGRRFEIRSFRWLVAEEV